MAGAIRLRRRRDRHAHADRAARAARPRLRAAGARRLRRLSVRENLLLGASAQPRPLGHRRGARTSSPSSASGWSRRAGTLSGGERKMLAIGRALLAGRSCCCSTSRPRASGSASSRRSPARLHRARARIGARPGRAAPRAGARGRRTTPTSWTAAASRSKGPSADDQEAIPSSCAIWRRERHDLISDPKEDIPWPCSPRPTASSSRRNRRRRCGLVADRAPTSRPSSTCMKPSIDGYNVVDAMPDNLPPVKYPRTPGHRPPAGGEQAQCLVRQDHGRRRAARASSRARPSCSRTTSCWPACR